MNGSFGNDENGNLVVGNNNQPFILALILGALQQMLGGGSSSGTGVVIGSGVGTYTAFHVANNGSTTIPTTAKRWAVNYVGTGTTNTFGTNASVTGGQGFADSATPSAAINIACDGSTVADGFYSTT